MVTYIYIHIQTRLLFFKEPSFPTWTEGVVRTSSAFISRETQLLLKKSCSSPVNSRTMKRLVPSPEEGRHLFSRAWIFVPLENRFEFLI